MCVSATAQFHLTIAVCLLPFSVCFRFEFFRFRFCFIALTLCRRQSLACPWRFHTIGVFYTHTHTRARAQYNIKLSRLARSCKAYPAVCSRVLGDRGDGVCSDIYRQLRESGRRTPFPASRPVTVSLSLSPKFHHCLLYTSPSPRDRPRSRMPSSA